MTQIKVITKQIRLNQALVCLLIFILAHTSPKAQQLLNLDFEQLSIEGMARPWGWDIITWSETKVQLDSSVKQNGSYSLRMEAPSNSEEHMLSFSLDPYELQNKTLTISGWIKTKELKGNVCFLLNYISEKDTAATEIKSRDISSETDWAQHFITVKLPGNILSISLSVQHKGMGIAWFDNLSLLVNGRRKTTLEIAPSFSQKQQDWIGKNSYPLKTVDVLNGNEQPGYDKDLAAFKSLAKDARIIALGESTHGASEFFRLKHRVLAYCVQNLDIRVFAIEDHQLTVTRVNKYVLGGPGTARSAMYGMLGVWQTKEVHDMIEWIRTYNDAHPGDKVEFAGFDIQNHSPQIDSLYSFIAKVAPALSQPLKERLDHLMKNGSNSYSVSDSVKQNWFIQANEVCKMISGFSAAWLSKARNRQDSLAVLWGIQYAALVKQFAENAYKGHASLYRDRAMADNISWILNVYKPGSKIMIWAHDVHISRGDHPDSTANIYGGRSMGAHLSTRYRNDYRSFGIFTYQGKYSCYVSYTNFRVTDCPLYTAPAGSLDEILHRVALSKRTPALLLDLGKARAMNWLVKPLPVRFANHVNIEYGYWTKYSIPYQFDGIFFIDKTSAAKSYARE